MIYVVATLTIKPGTRALNSSRAPRPASPRRVKETGCISYDLHRERHRSRRNSYSSSNGRNAEALGPHGASDHMEPGARIVKECISAPPKIEIITPEKVDVR